MVGCDTLLKGTRSLGVQRKLGRAFQVEGQKAGSFLRETRRGLWVGKERGPNPFPAIRRRHALPAPVVGRSTGDHLLLSPWTTVNPCCPSVRTGKISLNVPKAEERLPIFYQTLESCHRSRHFCPQLRAAPDAHPPSCPLASPVS